MSSRQPQQASWPCLLAPSQAHSMSELRARCKSSSGNMREPLQHAVEDHQGCWPERHEFCPPFVSPCCHARRGSSSRQLKPAEQGTQCTQRKLVRQLTTPTKWAWWLADNGCNQAPSEPSSWQHALTETPSSSAVMARLLHSSLHSCSNWLTQHQTARCPHAVASAASMATAVTCPSSWPTLCKQGMSSTMTVNDSVPARALFRWAMRSLTASLL